MATAIGRGPRFRRELETHISGTDEDQNLLLHEGPPQLDDELLPWPGEELVSRVASGTDRSAFFESGRQSVRDLQAVLGIAGRRLETFSEILDFGCGCGRILLHLEHLATTSKVHGVDIDARAVRWASENLPWADLQVNATEPPLPFEDATFDLVYNHSVFTHLDEHHQDLWLAELRRVTKVGGTVVLTVHGEKALSDFEEGSRNAGGNPALIRDEVRRRGISFLPHDSHVGGPHNEGYHSTFHAPWYVLDHWSGFFKVKAYVLQGSLGFQDVVLLERRGDHEAMPAGTRPVAEPIVAPVAALGAATLPDVNLAVHDPLNGPAPEAAARFGAFSRVLRRAVLRAISQYADYQRAVDQRVQRALWSLDAGLVEIDRELDRIRAAERVNGLLNLNESNVRLWDSLVRHGERINRLETDVWAAIDNKADRGQPDTDRSVAS